MSSKNEHVYYDANGVLVSSRRIVAQGVTYQLRNITSVAMGPVAKQSLNWIRVMLVVAGIGAVCATVPMAIEGNTAALVGGFVVLIGCGIAAIVHSQRQPKRYVLVFSTSGREVDGVTSTDPNALKRVLDAINQAMAANEDH